MKNIKRLFALCIVFTILLTQIGFGAILVIKDKNMTVTYNKTVGKTVTLIPNSTKIIGWQVNEGDVTITNNQFVMPDHEVEIEPIYSQVQYTLTIIEDENTTTRIEYEGSNVIVTSMYPNSFESWTAIGVTLSPAERVSSTIQFTMPAKDVTLTANYKLNMYTIRYDANGGTGGPSAQTKIHGIALVLSNDVPTRDGYNFLGWSTTSTATSAEYAPGGVFIGDANTSLYAVWEESVPTLASLVSIGDYVQYTPSIESYSVSSDDTGFYGSDGDGAQAFTPSTTTSWKVFNIEGDAVELISTNDVGGLRLKGYTGYNNMVNTLNSIAGAYVNPDYAVSGRSIGSTDQSVGTVAENLLATIGGGITPTDSPYTDTLYESDVQHILDNSLVVEENLYSQASWLASRIAKKNSSTSWYTRLQGRLFWNNGTTIENAMGQETLCDAKNSSDYTDSTSSNRGVRVIIKLKPGIKVNGGDGSTTPWILTNE